MMEFGATATQLQNQTNMPKTLNHFVSLQPVSSHGMPTQTVSFQVMDGSSVSVMSSSVSTSTASSLSPSNGDAETADDTDSDDEAAHIHHKKAGSSIEIHKTGCASSSYEKYRWIMKVSDGYLCNVCQNFGLKGQKDKVWTTKPLPLSASRKLYSKAAKHAGSQLHKAAVMAQKISISQGVDVVTKLVTSSNEAAIADADCMKLMFRVAHLLFVTEIPHTTHWRDLISILAECDLSGRLRKFLEKCPANAHHLSSSTVTAILEAFGTAMQVNLRSRVENLKEFAVMADECTDVNGVEKVSMCVRYLDKKQITELFLGCWSVQSTKAVDVHACIVDKLALFGLSPERLVSAAFDGASNMSGHRGGVQALLKEVAPS